MKKYEIAASRGAQEALDKEWSRLRAANCWDETGVREWADVACEARLKGWKAHVGLIFEICVEKGSELPIGHPDEQRSR